MDSTNHTAKENHTGYGTYVLIWLTLVGLTVSTVAVAGIDLGRFILLAALLIAAVKSTLVINVFMHIKYEEPIFKVFLTVALLTLLSLFVLLSFDVFFK